MPSAVGTALLGAFQASFLMLLTLGYGVFAARWGIMSSGSAKDVSRLCVNLFLPALLITNVGSEANPHNVANYVPVFVWAVVYPTVSFVLAQSCSSVLKLPS